MNLDFDYSGVTKLKNWWRQVKSNFQIIEDEVNEHEDTTAASTTEGHVKLSDTVSTSYTASNGFAATPYAVSTRAIKNHRSSTSDYGLGTSSYYGHVKLSDSTDDTSHGASGGVAATPAAVAAAYSAATAAATYYGTCETAAATSTKVVECSSFTSLTAGARIAVKFTYAHTANTAYLNVNSTGAKQVYFNSDNVLSTTNTWNAGDVIEFVYDGTYWYGVGGEKPPKDHRSTYNTYGCGDSEYYGHVALSDSVIDKAHDVDGCTAATPYAVSQVYLKADNIAKDLADAVANTETDLYYPEYHSDDVTSTTNFYLDCANLDGEGTALFKAEARGISKYWTELVSGANITLASSSSTYATIEDDGIVAATSGTTKNTTLSSYAGFNTASSFTILFDACIPQLDSSSTSYCLFKLGGNRTLQILQTGTDGLRLVVFDADKTQYTYPAAVLANGSDLDDGKYTTGHYVVPLNTAYGSGYGDYQHFAVVFDTSASTVTWYMNGEVYTSDTMSDSYVFVDGGYTAMILQHEGMGLRYFKIVRSAMTATEVAAYMTAHPHTNYTGQPKTQYDNKLLDLEEGLRYFGTCTTAAATQIKSVTVDDGFELKTGARVAVQFTIANNASNAMLNVNSTGGKAMRLNSLTTSTSNTWAANDVIEFIYDGTNWRGVVNNVATGTKYGRIRLSDSTTSTSSTSGGYAATPYAVRQVYNAVRHNSTFVVAANDSYGYNYADYKCDGEADENEINLAISAASTGGGRVVLLEGTYTLGSPIYMAANVTLQGQGAGTVLERGFNDSSEWEYGMINSAGNCVIRDMTLNGVLSTYTTSVNKAIKAKGYDIIEGVTIYNSQRGIIINGGNRTRVRGSLIYDCPTGIFVYYSSHNMITDCIIETASTAAISIDWYALRNVVANNYISDSTYSILTQSNSNYNSIMGNTFRAGDANYQTYSMNIQSYYNTIVGNVTEQVSTMGISYLSGNTLSANYIYGV